MSEKKEIKTYIATTLALSFLYQVFIGWVTHGSSLESSLNLLLVLMYLPGLIALAFLLVYKEGFQSLKLGIKQPIFLLYSLVIPCGITFLCFFLLESIGVSHQSVFDFKNSQIVFLDRSMPIITFLPYFLIIMVLGSLQGGIFALGEELGWRGYLQNKMIREFGIIPGIVFLGLVWGYWHLPIILMGYNFSEYRILGAFLLMPLQTIAFSAVWAWLTLRAKSIWPAILAHGATNFWLSDVFVERIYIKQKLWMHLFLTGMWLIAGVAALVALRVDNQKSRLKIY